MNDKMASSRLNGGQRVSKYANQARDHTPRAEAQRLADLEKARNKLGDLINQYKQVLITDKKLPENRTQIEKTAQYDIISSIYGAVEELDLRNVGEGTMVAIATCLHTGLILRDESNKLRFQNYYLSKTVEALKADVKILMDLNVAKTKLEPTVEVLPAAEEIK